jgi:hypothetical protein
MKVWQELSGTLHKDASTLMMSRLVILGMRNHLDGYRKY